MGNTIAELQTIASGNSQRQSASRHDREPDAQPMALTIGQRLPGISQRGKLDIGLLASTEILALQRGIGNQALARLAARGASADS